MVQTQIRDRGVLDPRVLEAMGQVPRECFVPPGLESHAYGDCALNIGYGQTISQPYMVAMMTEALALTGHERVLEIGTGSGYQAAVLSALAAEVISVERIPELASEAATRLHELGYHNVRVEVGDGSLGLPQHAPFGGILVTAAAPAAPPPLLSQLHADGGRLVLPVGDRSLQQIHIVRRDGTEFTTEKRTACRFVPLLGEEGWSGEQP
jgi:protein-L-isoaspartate(D-aspartate) O-methyltransferase